MFIIYFLLFFPLFNSQCDSYKDCLNCSSMSKCEWISGACIERSSTNDRWYTKYLTCYHDSQSKATIYKYCGESEIDDDYPIEISLVKNDNAYMINNLYCQWEVEVNEDKTITVNFTRNANNKNVNELYSIEYYFTDDSQSQSTIDNNEYYLSSKILSKVIFHYFSGYISSVDPSIQPFTLVIDIDDTLTVFDIVIIVIVVILCIFLVILLFVMGYQCLMSFLKRQMDESDVIANNITTIRKQTEEKNKKVLEEMLKPIEYEDAHGTVYGDQCTICIEKFQPKDKVILLQCKHLFHEGCLRKWLENKVEHPKCPNCNVDIIKEKCDENNVLVLNRNTNNIVTQRETELNHMRSSENNSVTSDINNTNNNVVIRVNRSIQDSNEHMH